MLLSCYATRYGLLSVRILNDRASCRVSVTVPVLALVLVLVEVRLCTLPFVIHKGQDNRTNIPKQDGRLRSELTQHPSTVTPTNLPDLPHTCHVDLR